jgi:hypothetical protein
MKKAVYIILDLSFPIAMDKLSAHVSVQICR